MRSRFLVVFDRVKPELLRDLLDVVPWRPRSLSLLTPDHLSDGIEDCGSAAGITKMMLMSGGRRASPRIALCCVQNAHGSVLLP